MAPVRTLALVLLVSALAALSFAPHAAATIVWAGNGNIWAVEDDLSNPRIIASYSALGMPSGLSQPHVNPTGGQTVVFEGTTNVNNHFYNGTFHCGFGCTGVYKWTPTGGAVRMSAAPLYYQGASQFDLEPEATSDGRFVYTYFHCTGYVSGNIGSYLCIRRLYHHNLNDSGSAEYGSGCNDADDLGAPSPDPANPGRIAYVGCFYNGSPALVLSGPSRAGEFVVGTDDQPFRDPSFRSDGQYLVDAEDGGSPGLWVSKADGTSFRQALVQPAGVQFRSPRFMGAAQDTIIFSVHNGGYNGDLYAIPASCNGCAFPAAATPITNGGGNSAPAWTSASLAPPPPPPPPPPPSAGPPPPPPPPPPVVTPPPPPPPPATSSSPSGGTVTTATPTSSEISKESGGGGTATVKAPGLSIMAPKRFKLSKKSKGLPLAFKATGAGTVKVRLLKGTKTVAKGGLKFISAGSVGFRLKLPKTVKKGKYSLKVVWTPTGGKAVTRTLTVKMLAGAASAGRSRGDIAVQRRWAALVRDHGTIDTRTGRPPAPRRLP